MRHMSDGATRKDIDEVIDILHTFMQQVSDKFDQVDRKFDAIDMRFDAIDLRLDELDRKYERLLGTLTQHH